MYDIKQIDKGSARRDVGSIVVLGAGQAGAWVAKTLRSEGYAGEITLVGDELHAPYERPALSKDVLAGTASPQSTQVFSADAFASLGARWLRGVTAESVDRSAKRVDLADGTSTYYDKLIFCTGGRARRPPIVGIEHPGVFTLRTLDDARLISSELKAAQRVCVIGGGWIGLEVAATARRLGKDVALLERGTRLCKRVLPASVSDYLLQLHSSEGVEVRLAEAPELIERIGGRLRVASQSGSEVVSDLAVIGAGLVANDDLAAAAGLRCANGIVVDERCSTSDPDIFAAGDVTLAPNSCAGALVRLESWQNATEQAAVAARSALGLDARYDPLPWFWSDQFQVNLQIYGWPRPEHRCVTRILPGKESHLTFLLEGEVLAAVVGVNAPKDVRAARKLIEQRKPLRDADLLNADVRISTL